MGGIRGERVEERSVFRRLFVFLFFRGAGQRSRRAWASKRSQRWFLRGIGPRGSRPQGSDLTYARSARALSRSPPSCPSARFAQICGGNSLPVSLVVISVVNRSLFRETLLYPRKSPRKLKYRPSFTFKSSKDCDRIAISQLNCCDFATKTVMFFSHLEKSSALERPSSSLSGASNCLQTDE